MSKNIKKPRFALMPWLAGQVTSRGPALCIIAAFILITLMCAYQMRLLKDENDILAFLPEGNPEVDLFYNINNEFGGLDMALVGIESPDIFTPDFLRRLDKTSKELREIIGLNSVMSLSNVIDYEADEEQGGVTMGPLLSSIPTSQEEALAFKEKALSRDHLIGNLVSEDGNAIVIYCYLAYKSDPNIISAKIKDIVNKNFPNEAKYWGGQPFISSYVYQVTQNDLHNLIPWALLAIVAILIISFRDAFGSLLVLGTTGMGVIITFGLMATFNAPYNIVISAMPIVLFAIGSAYSTHFISRYYNYVTKMDKDAAIIKAMKTVGPIVIASGLTTMVGLGSFIFMDITPLRSFGIYTALGIFASLVLSVTFVPAVLHLGNFRRHTSSDSPLQRKLMVELCVFARRFRKPLIATMAVVTAVGIFFAAKVDVSADQSSFFAKGSLPDLADEFMQKNFGGAGFVQLLVNGPMDDPTVIREMRALGDKVMEIPDVTSAVYIGSVLSQSNDAMSGYSRVPDNPAQAKLLYAFFQGDPTVGQMINSKHTRALMQIRVQSLNSERQNEVLKEIEKLTAGMNGQYAVYKNDTERSKSYLYDMTAKHIAALSREYGATAKPLADIRASIAAPFALPTEKVVERLADFMTSAECAVPLETSGEVNNKSVAAVIGTLGDTYTPEALEAKVKEALGEERFAEMGEDLYLSIETPLAEYWRLAKAEVVTERLLNDKVIVLAASAKGQRLPKQLTMTAMDLTTESVLMPYHEGDNVAAGSLINLDASVSGLPVMYRGLSRSVAANQVKSLVFALSGVFLILTIIFGSFTSGLLATFPTLLTLLFVYGAMGFLNIRLDIGTSMLASIILGMGVDYAVHLTAAWYAPEKEPIIKCAANAADQAGPSIWTNAIMIFCGFFVLTLGQAVPLKNVGGLTAAAMLVAALVTFFVIPMLSRRHVYYEASHSEDEALPSEAVNNVLSKLVENQAHTR